MKIEVRIDGGVLQWQAIDGLKDGIYSVTINNLESKTTQQVRALYLWMNMISNVLNSENITTVQIIRPDIKWTPEKVKYLFIKPVVDVLFKKQSLANLNKTDFDLIINTVVKAFGQRGVSLPAFPTQQEKDI